MLQKLAAVLSAGAGPRVAASVAAARGGLSTEAFVYGGTAFVLEVSFDESIFLWIRPP